MGRAVGRLDTFAEIPRLSGESRRDAWRHAMAQLASLAADRVPVPLEGMDVSKTEQTVRWALSEGLLDDMAWLLPKHGAVALYELAGALRPGPERRELGRRAIEHLRQGDAATFAALARRIAMGSRRGLSGPGIAPRVNLVLGLPDGIAAEAEEDGLALALLTHPDFVKKWVIEPSMGALSSRRLAARLLERAAREAVRRSTDRQGQVASLFERQDIQRTWTALLADREPLVWRHVASARGLLSQLIPMLDGEIARDLDSALSATQWRRAAASAAAACAVERDSAVSRCKSILSGPIFQADPGVAEAMVLGLSRAASAEPRTVEALLDQLVEIGGLDVIEALVQFRHEHFHASIGASAVVAARKRLASDEFVIPGDEGRTALLRALDRDLDTPIKAETALPNLITQLRMAQEAFAFDGASAAYFWAQETLSDAESLIERLEATASEDAEDHRAEQFFILRELDFVMLERSTLSDLLALGADAGESLARLDTQLGRIGDWLLKASLIANAESDENTSFTFEKHRLRAMLHLVDSSAGLASGTSVKHKERTLRMARWFLERLSQDSDQPTRRIIAVSAAGACDALLREEIGELSDVLIMIGDRVRDPIDILTMAEAAMDPAMGQVLRSYSAFLRACQRQSTSIANRLPVLTTLEDMIKALPELSTPRVEALRGGAVALMSSLSALYSVRCLAQVAGGTDGNRPCIPPIAAAVGWLTRLAAGGRLRMSNPGAVGKLEAPRSESALCRIDAGVEHALRGNSEPLRAAVADGFEIVRSELPIGLAGAVCHALDHLIELPLELDSDEPCETTRPRSQAPLVLPAWMPANRILGGYYVLRLLGHGGVGSVFVVCRAEDKTRHRPTQFAMKIPEYGANAAHTLSESEFLDLFRDEAGALLSIPRHANLAQFVTFDAGTRPKPVLVMEFVEGPTLERLIATRVLEMSQALSVLDGIASGLEAMHALGIGHLDIKPGNVILRSAEERLDPEIAYSARVPASATLSEAKAVLVDFGLAGRRIRPGCATAEYGAPEIWGYLKANQEPPPMAADVYAFACLAYETLTGETLIQGPNNTAVISNHIKHDGEPDGVERLRRELGLVELANALGKGLRRNYLDRCTIGELRKGIAASKLDGLTWPIRVGTRDSYPGTR